MSNFCESYPETLTSNTRDSVGFSFNPGMRTGASSGGEGKGCGWLGPPHPQSCRQNKIKMLRFWWKKFPYNFRRFWKKNYFQINRKKSRFFFGFFFLRIFWRVWKFFLIKIKAKKTLKISKKSLVPEPKVKIKIIIKCIRFKTLRICSCRSHGMTHQSAKFSYVFFFLTRLCKSQCPPPYSIWRHFYTPTRFFCLKMLRMFSEQNFDE